MAWQTIGSLHGIVPDGGNDAQLQYDPDQGRARLVFIIDNGTNSQFIATVRNLFIAGANLGNVSVSLGRNQTGQVGGTAAVGGGQNISASWYVTWLDVGRRDYSVSGTTPVTDVPPSTPTFAVAASGTTFVSGNVNVGWGSAGSGVVTLQFYNKAVFDNTGAKTDVVNVQKNNSATTIAIVQGDFTTQLKPNTAYYCDLVASTTVGSSEIGRIDVITTPTAPTGLAQLAATTDGGTFGGYVADATGTYPITVQMQAVVAGTAMGWQNVPNPQNLVLRLANLRPNEQFQVQIRSVSAHRQSTVASINAFTSMPTPTASVTPSSQSSSQISVDYRTDFGQGAQSVVTQYTIRRATDTQASAPVVVPNSPAGSTSTIAIPAPQKGQNYIIEFSEKTATSDHFKSSSAIIQPYTIFGALSGVFSDSQANAFAKVLTWQTDAGANAIPAIWQYRLGVVNGSTVWAEWTNLPSTPSGSLQISTPAPHTKYVAEIRVMSPSGDWSIAGAVTDSSTPTVDATLGLAQSGDTIIYQANVGNANRNGYYLRYRLWSDTTTGWSDWTTLPAPLAASGSLIVGGAQWVAQVQVVRAADDVVVASSYLSQNGWVDVGELAVPFAVAFALVGSLEAAFAYQVYRAANIEADFAAKIVRKSDLVGVSDWRTHNVEGMEDW